MTRLGICCFYKIPLNTVEGGKKIPVGLTFQFFLLSFSVRRTHVIDDESDYFSADSNQWLSMAEREVLRKKEQELLELRHASKSSRKVTIDFAGRKVFEEGDRLTEYHTR